MPTPMKPSVIRLLGATAPSAPRTEEGTTQGAAAKAAARFNHSRLLGFIGQFLMALFIRREGETPSRTMPGIVPSPAVRCHCGTGPAAGIPAG